MALISRLFVACPRCGYFLTGYRARMGVERLEETIAEIQNIEESWLDLGWGHPMLELLERTYGCELPNDVTHFEERCSECSRILLLGQTHDAMTLRIQVKPHVW